MSVDATGPQQNPDGPAKFDVVRAVTVCVFAGAAGVVTAVLTDPQVGATVFAAILGTFGKNSPNSTT